MTAHSDLSIELATTADVPELVQLHLAVARELTATHGRGPWSAAPGEGAIRRGLLDSHTFVGRRSGQIEGTARLTKKKPWAIDPAFFTPAARPVYLLDMAVRPDVQRRGVGTALLTFALTLAARTGFDSVRLDAYDSPAGAGGFYSKCGMTWRGQRSYRSTPLVYFEAAGLEASRS